MSSRELLDELLGIVIETNDQGIHAVVCAGFLPESSVLNTALRGGDWSSETYRQRDIVNEIRALRGQQGGFSLEYLLSPAEEAAEKAHENWQKSRHDEALAQLRGERR